MPSTHTEDTTPSNKPVFFPDASLFSRDLLLSCGTVLVLDGCLYLDVVFSEVPLCSCDVCVFFLTITDALI